MLLHISLAQLAATPNPTPSMTVPAESVTPGPMGFVVMALLVVVVFLLVWDMQRRIRRSRYRAEANERIDEELAAQQASRAEAASDTDDADVDAAGDAWSDDTSDGPTKKP